MSDTDTTKSSNMPEINKFYNLKNGKIYGVCGKTYAEAILKSNEVCVAKDRLCCGALIGCTRKDIYNRFLSDIDIFVE